MEQSTEKPNMELLASFVTVEAKHVFTDIEISSKSKQLARLMAEIESEEAEKKARAAEYKNKIDKLKAEAKLVAGHITNGYAFQDFPAELYLDYGTNERVYIDKQNGAELSRENFHSSDFQKKIDFTGIDPETQVQIDFNNAVGNIAEGDGDNASTDLKPTPKGNLPDNYGANFEQEEALTDGNGLYRDQFGNPTDIHPAQLKDELENGPGASELDKIIKEKVANHRAAKRGLLDKKEKKDADNLPPE